MAMGYLGCVCVCVSFRTRSFSVAGKDGSKVTIVVATPGQGPDRPQEISYTDPKVIGNGSFGVVFEAKLCETGELVAIKKVLQDKRFKVSEHSDTRSARGRINSDSSLLVPFRCRTESCRS